MSSEGTKREVRKQKFELARKQPWVFTGKSVGGLSGTAALISKVTDVVA